MDDDQKSQIPPIGHELPTSTTIYSARVIMASSGLSRRRVGASSTAQDDELGSPWGPPNGDGASSPTSNGSSSAAATPKLSHAGSAFEGGSRIAYDPIELDREKQEARSGGRMPKLTIMEEVFLLGLKDKEVCSVLFVCRLTIR